MRPGYTTPELMVVLAVSALLLLVAIPRFTALRDRAAAHGAANDVAAALTLARHAAIVRATHSAVRLDTASASVIVQTPRGAALDTVLARPLGAVHAATLETTRDSIAFAPTGLGYGAANTRIILHRGQAAETIWVSRLGRVRRQ
jgi:prepilin-type N-terminal cleavage/methylation domain-containing protein